MNKKNSISIILIILLISLLIGCQISDSLNEDSNSSNSSVSSSSTTSSSSVSNSSSSSSSVTGNLFLNGDFSDGAANWSCFVNETGEASMEIIDGRAKIIITDPGTMQHHVGIAQIDLNLESGSTYEFSFDVQSTVDMNIKSVFQLQQSPWTPYDQHQYALTADDKITYHYTFICNTTDADAGFNFHLGAGVPGDIYLDNLVLKKVDNSSSSSSSSSSVTGNLFLNGDFSGGAANWSCFVNETGEASMEIIDGRAKIIITDPGTMQHHVGIAQIDLNLEAGSTYEFSFDVQSTVDMNIKSVFQLQQSPWTPYDQHQYALTADDKITYHYTFICNTTDADAGFNFHLGAGVPGDIYLDNLVLKKND